MRETPEYRIDCDLSFKPCQRSTQAIMYSLAKSQMPIVLASDIQRIRVLELSFITVGGSKHYAAFPITLLPECN